MDSAFGIDHGEVYKARRGPGVTRGRRDPSTSMRQRGGSKPYFNPSPEQVAASQGRRRLQQAVSEDYQQNIKPKIRTGGGKKIPWAEHRAAMGAKTPRNLAGTVGLAALAGGSLIAYNHHEREKIKKSDDKDKAVGAALGGTAGYAGTKAGYSTAGVAGKITLKNRRAKRGESAHERKIWSDYARKNKVTYANGKPAHWSAYAKYPKELPDWKLQRALAYKGSPKVKAGVLAGGAALGATAGALSTRRNHDR